MLYWIWFIGLSLLGWGFALRQRRLAGEPQQDGAMSRAGVARWMSYGALLLALLISWDGVGREVVAWLETAVPQAGTDIHELSVAVLGGALCIAWVLLPAWLAGRASREREDTGTEQG